jgi:hypothetical protein
MQTQFRLLLACAALVLPFAGALGDESNPTQAVIAKLRPVLPVGWTISAQRSGVIPEGHHWGQTYTGVRGWEIVLRGPRDVHLLWQDAAGVWHTDVKGREALKIYVMPSTYRDNVLRFFVPKRPIAARLIHDGPACKVYAHPSFEMLMPDDAFRQIVKKSQEIRSPDSPPMSELSWGTWKEDIRQALAKR